MIKKVLSIIVVSFALIGCSPARVAFNSATDLLKDTALASAHVGIHIYDIDAARTLYDYQAEKFFVPASNTKLVTMYAALKFFGDSLLSVELGENDTAIYIRPKGDPTTLHPDYPQQPVISFLQNAAKPVYLISPTIQPAPFGLGWSWSDYNYAYSAERSSFPLYGNVIKWVQERTGDAPAQENVMDESVMIFSLPEVNWRVRFSTDTSRKSFYVWRERYDNIFNISQGNDKKAEQDVPFIAGKLQAAVDLLPDTIRKTVSVLDKELPPGITFRKFYSQRTDSLLKPLMHRSDNFFAEQVLLMLSEEKFQVMDESRIISHLLEGELREFPQTPRWADGSGLSRFNLFSPRDFTFLLVKLKAEFGMERLKILLPTGGQGTLKQYYLQDSGYLFAKTGTLSGVIALSGYMLSEKGRWLAFSVLVNNHRANAVSIRRRVEGFLQAVRKRH